MDQDCADTKDPLPQRDMQADICHAVEHNFLHMHVEKTVLHKQAVF